MEIVINKWTSQMPGECIISTNIYTKRKYFWKRRTLPVIVIVINKKRKTVTLK